MTDRHVFTADELRVCRMDANITVRQMAEKFAVSHVTYGEVERGLIQIPDDWQPILRRLFLPVEGEM